MQSFEIDRLLLFVYRVMAVPATVIYFTCYDQLRDLLRYGMGFQGNYIPLVAGGLARRKWTTWDGDSQCLEVD